MKSEHMFIACTSLSIISGGLSSILNLRACDFLEADPCYCKYRHYSSLSSSSLSIATRNVLSVCGVQEPSRDLRLLIALRGGTAEDFLNIFGEDTIESGKSDEDDEWVCVQHNRW